MLTIERKSPRTGKINSMTLNITEEQIKRWREGEFIQDVMPNLTPDEREFLMTGYTKEDWKAIFGEENE